MANRLIERYKVVFVPDKVEILVSKNTTILQAAIEAGIWMTGPCGGKGTCGKCLVEIKDWEEKKSVVLACETFVNSNITVRIPPRGVSLLRKGETGQEELGIEVQPGIWKKKFSIDKPEISNQRSDLTRFYEAFGREIPLTITALRQLPKALREMEHIITVTYTQQLVLSIEPGNTEGKLFGLAVDIGTTTVVAALVNLKTGNLVGQASATNTQNIFGADVISRIEHTVSFANGLEQVQQRIVQVLNSLIKDLCTDGVTSPDNVYKVVVVGNTTMEHLFIGIDPRYLAPAPFIPVTSHQIELEAREIGLHIFSHGRVHLIPNIAGYVGGDTTAVILATNIHKKTGVYLVVDIGTNGEIILSVNGKLSACSTAAGPAFEGAHIRHGMRAECGAIESVTLDQDICLGVIGDGDPKGICGSGLIQALHVMVELGVLEQSGKMISRNIGEEKRIPESILKRLRTDKDGNYFLLAFPFEDLGAIVITQKDVREFQLAKGAIRTGIEILIKDAGIHAEDIDEILVAGAFGNYINRESALYLGLLPDLPLERIKVIGNAAELGARMALISRTLLEETRSIAQKVRHLELSRRSDFHKLFVQFMRLGRTD